jgi:hypothetical protein
MSKIQVCNIDYDNELNQRIMSRIMPSQELAPAFSPRPEPTKYSQFKTHTKKLTNNIPLRKYDYFNTNNVFFTGNTKPPIQFALDNVDLESRLRNQFFALQKNDQAFYIPDTTSQLYNHDNKIQGLPNQHDTQKINYTIETNTKCNLAPNTFNNSTRYNLKNLK